MLPANSVIEPGANAPFWFPAKKHRTTAAEVMPEQWLPVVGIVRGHPDLSDVIYIRVMSTSGRELTVREDYFSNQIMMNLHESPPVRSNKPLRAVWAHRLGMFMFYPLLLSKSARDQMIMRIKDQ